MRAGTRHWLSLGALVLLWGSSYSLVEVALRALTPGQVAGSRILTGALVLGGALFLPGPPIPRGGRFLALALAVALLGNCLPFFLISWGQARIESGLAGILAATTPLCVLVLSHWMLRDERLEGGQLAAFLLAFAGIVILLGVESLAGLGGSSERLLGSLAVLAAAFCYALSTVLARFMPGGRPLVVAAVVLGLAALVSGPLTLPGLPALSGLPRSALAAVAILGVFGTGLASVLYFRLVAEAGARFVSLLNFLVPVWAVALGTLLLGETLPASAWLALALILGGLVLTQRRSVPGP
jgi:drug/metabolite transporter (DMT)-like permease